MRISNFVNRLIVIAIFIIFSLGVCGLFSRYNSSEGNIALPANATPITNKVIVIDAGHGLPDEGAVGFNGTTEEAINLSIALKLQRIIEQSGAKVVLTRSDENGIYDLDSSSIRNKKVSDIKNRVEIGNGSDADILISIHLNKYPPSEYYRGWQTFYQKQKEESKILAELLQESIGKNIEFKNSRTSLPIDGVYLMDHVEVPSVIVECGFLSNPEEANLLKTDSYQNKLAWGIYIGIQEYFEKNMEE